MHRFLDLKKVVIAVFSIFLVRPQSQRVRIFFKIRLSNNVRSVTRFYFCNGGFEYLHTHFSNAEILGDVYKQVGDVRFVTPLSSLLSTLLFFKFSNPYL